MMEEARIIVCFISLLVAAKADYTCICNYNAELTVRSTMSEQASQQGSMYEFDCKATMPGVAVNQGWAAVAFEHKLGYVKLNDNAKAQTCPGDPPTDDLVTTMSMSMATDSTKATTTAASSGSPVSLGAQTTFTTMAPSSASTVTAATVTTVTSPPASTFTTTPSTTTVTTTYPTTKRVVSSTEHTTTATTGSTEHTTTATTGSTEHTTTATTGSTEHTTTATTGSTEHTTTATTGSTEHTSTATTGSTEHTRSTTATTGTTITFLESTTTTLAVSCPTTHGMTTTFQQSCYEFVSHHSTWSSAESDCRHKGGHLMHITNAVEQDFITKFLIAHFNHEVWIGLNDHHHEEQFEWTSGTPLKYTHWDPNRKDFFIHAIEDCVALQPSHQGYWDDRQCTGILAARHSYVCQYTGKNPGSVIIG